MTKNKILIINFLKTQVKKETILIQSLSMVESPINTMIRNAIIQYLKLTIEELKNGNI